ncbi:antibiotic biosynthesis monooxygenase family protein [Chromobacterium sphagni]|uniref:Antibiotic biosynthesis monooxygenase n=1 Tax=Chromobacterium sphagni TaxID=1903179 RepID=A0A1S1WYL0_9NEIS|nr:antibiotic biosynthesis monooxygenase [Chromobacterium sphagni]OHX12362.1 antibiotic biosynthesis monooxygenase [Chromobacterium sphagni]OHX21554.1 antibiotic biosynthesis monooxygenase [Chromobacterium sphagni]
MIAVIFEATPAADGRDGYLQWAARLGEQLAQMDGFVSIERFQSLARPDTLLSLSFWRDEEAVAAWRNLESHRMAQAAGRERLFAGYRLRVAAVLRDYGMNEREQAPADSGAAHSA